MNKQLTACNMRKREKKSYASIRRQATLLHRHKDAFHAIKVVEALCTEENRQVNLQGGLKASLLHSFQYG